MKRIQLFEFEDFKWFPKWLRRSMTQYINTVHQLLGTNSQISELLASFLSQTENRHLIDLCSGSGGPMPEVWSILQTKYGYPDLKLTLTDLYPDQKTAEKINSGPDPNITYRSEPTDARLPPALPSSILTLICSFHHMNPQHAAAILNHAATNQRPIFIYEISDNSFPKWLWWIAIPFNFITVFLLTPMVRPLTVTQLVFTYLIPVLPLVIAWDGAVSNARTYTLQDLDSLCSEIDSSGYYWEKNTIPGRGGRKLYLMGSPGPIEITRDKIDT